MKRRTKIVCTLGPAVNSREGIKSLIDAGMNVARLNCSHGDWEAKAQWIEWIRELSPECAPVAIMADLQGPKFRIGLIENDILDVKSGSVVTVGEGMAQIPIHQKEILSALDPGVKVLLGDGVVELKIIDGENGLYRAKALSGGIVKTKQGITVRDRVFDTPALTKKDIEDVQQAVKYGVDYIALSYVKHAMDIRQLRQTIDRLDPAIRIVAKIEMADAIQDLKNILQVADVIMVARGDLGLQMDIEAVPIAQKKIIDLCTLHGRPVITATQMLESMMENPRPTRAEATDVANAILDGTDAVMLSGETASGQYPVECVRTMARIAERAEGIFDRERLERDFQERSRSTISRTEAIAHSVADLAAKLKPEAIVTTTASGQTPRLVSKFRPKAPILCASYDERVTRQMAVVWGVEAITIKLDTTTEATISHAIDSFLHRKKLALGDHVLVTAGVPAGTTGNTNMILSEVVR
ncbi:MAG: pyruvate kinase [Armatimonadetes bacterium]|nr:pyruvate kinase [Armatimonadota bacterium]